MCGRNTGIQMKREKITQDIYDDFKLKKTLVSVVYIKVFQRFKGELPVTLSLILAA